MKLTIPKKGKNLVNGIRLSDEVFKWISAMAKRYEVSNQVIIKEVLQTVYNKGEKRNI